MPAIGTDSRDITGGNSQVISIEIWLSLKEGSI